MATDIQRNAEEEEFLEIFRIIAPELSDTTDAMILAMRKLCLPMISQCRFGDLYDQALAYLVAHRLTYQNMIAAGGGAGSAGVVAGNVVSEKEGDLQRSYGSSGSSGNGSGSGYTDTLDKTAYGLEFKRIRDMVIVTAMTRFG